jgi:hypothetical protein
MILQIHTEKELIDMVGALKKEIGILRDQNNSYLKKLDLMQADIDKKPSVQIKETITRELPPVINNITNGVSSNDVLELINKHVTITYVNKLYKKG